MIVLGILPPRVPEEPRTTLNGYSAVRVARPHGAHRWTGARGEPVLRRPLMYRAWRPAQPRPVPLAVVRESRDAD